MMGKLVACGSCKQVFLAGPDGAGPLHLCSDGFGQLRCWEQIALVDISPKVICRRCGAEAFGCGCPAIERRVTDRRKQERRNGQGRRKNFRS